MRSGNEPLARTRGTRREPRLAGALEWSDECGQHPRAMLPPEPSAQRRSYPNEDRETDEKNERSAGAGRCKSPGHGRGGNRDHAAARATPRVVRSRRSGPAGSAGVTGIVRSEGPECSPTRGRRRPVVALRPIARRASAQGDRRVRSGGRASARPAKRPHRTGVRGALPMPAARLPDALLLSMTRPVDRLRLRRGRDPARAGRALLRLAAGQRLRHGRAGGFGRVAGCRHGGGHGSLRGSGNAGHRRLRGSGARRRPSPSCRSRHPFAPATVLVTVGTAAVGAGSEGLGTAGGAGTAGTAGGAGTFGTAGGAGTAGAAGTGGAEAAGGGTGAGGGATGTAGGGGGCGAGTAGGVGAAGGVGVLGGGGVGAATGGAAPTGAPGTTPRAAAGAAKPRAAHESADPIPSRTPNVRDRNAPQ